MKKWIKNVLQRFMASIQGLTDDLVMKGEITAEEPPKSQRRLIIADSKGVFCQKGAVMPKHDGLIDKSVSLVNGKRPQKSHPKVAVLFVFL